MSPVKGEAIGYELKAVLFADGTFFGPESIFQNFSDTMSTVRDLARDAMYAPDKYDFLSRERMRMRGQMSPEDTLKAMRDPSTDFRALELRSNMAATLLDIRDSQGEREAEAALRRLAALPDIRAVA